MWMKHWQREVELTNGGSGLGTIIGGVVRSALSGESILIVRFSNPTKL